MSDKPVWRYTTFSNKGHKPRKLTVRIFQFYFVPYEKSLFCCLFFVTLVILVNGGVKLLVAKGFFTDMYPKFKSRKKEIM